MDIRSLANGGLARRLVTGMRDLNARHPWNHNDYFHAWILTELPESRHNALDIGCGRGELLAALAERFAHVHGTDTDEAMRQAASARCAGLPNVMVDAAHPEDVVEHVDLVTMVAVLHNLDVETVLEDVSQMLSPGGRFLCVGLARPASAHDQLRDIASMVTNPLIGYVRHPWVAHDSPVAPPVPVKDPQLSLDELRGIIARTMPAARIRRRLGFRHTIEWTKPKDSGG